MKHIVAMLLMVVVLTVPYWAGATEQGRDNPDQALLTELEKASGGHVRLSRHSATGRVRFLAAEPGQTLTQAVVAQGEMTADVTARAFLAEYGALFGIADPGRELALVSERALADGRSVVRYQQTYQGIPVLAGEMVVHVAGGKGVLSANGEVAPKIELDVTPRIGAAAARQKALEVAAKEHGVAQAELAASELSLWIYDPALLGGPGMRLSRLVWRVEVTPAGELLPIRELVLVDAHSGIVALNFNQIHSGKDRETYDAQGTGNLPGVLRRSEGEGPYGDADVDNAHDYAGDTYDFLFNQHGRDSLDDAGMTLISTVDYCPPGACPFNNAFWNGQQMAYGDGFASADDVVGHELAHGFTEHTSNLFYYYQSGAINESLSDVWGELVDLTNSGGTDTAAVRWQLGEDVPGLGAIRSMKDPTLYGDPDRIGSSNYYCGEQDTGGVHWNSGVNNKAAYLMVDGGSFNGQTITGLGIPRVADLYYEVQTNFLTSGSTFADLYDGLLQAAENLDFAAAEQETVQKALLAVEMAEPPCENEPEPPLCPSGMSPYYVFNDDMEDTDSGKWTTGAIVGTNHWYSPQVPNSVPYSFLNDFSYASSGQYHLWGYSQASIADYYVRMTDAVTIPTNGYLRFAHDWNFPQVNHGGMVEYSVNGGSWTDAGALFTHNGYSGVISSSNGNPLDGRSAFVGESYGYTTSRLNLSALAGEDVRFRFRIGTDSTADDYGWFIDDVSIYHCVLDGFPSPAPLTATATETATPAATATATATGTSTPTSTATTSTATATKAATATVEPDNYRMLLPVLTNESS